MNSDRRTNAPSRLLILWIVGFLVIGLVASYTFFNLVREIVKTWNTTALAAPSAPAPVTDPTTGEPQPVVIADWQGVERVNILLLGIDERSQESGPWRTDTMMLATVDPISKTAGLLSIPRDLWVAIPGLTRKARSTPRTSLAICRTIRAAALRWRWQPCSTIWASTPSIMRG